MNAIQERSAGNAMQAVSNTMVKLHKEQFGRGPTNARSYFAGPDTLVCTLEDALLPAERAMVSMGEPRPQGPGVHERDRSRRRDRVGDLHVRGRGRRGGVALKEGRQPVDPT